MMPPQGDPPPGRPIAPATDPLFREEAVRDYNEGRTHGRLLRISPAWMRWVEPLLLATIAGAGLFLGVATVDHIVQGPAVVRRLDDVPSAGGASFEVIALFPARDRAHIPASPLLSVRLDGPAPRSLLLDATFVADEILGPERVRLLLGDAADLVAIDGPTFLLRAALPADSAAAVGAVPGSTGRAQIHVGRRRLFTELFAGDAP